MINFPSLEREKERQKEISCQMILILDSIFVIVILLVRRGLKTYMIDPTKPDTVHHIYQKNIITS